MKSTNRGSAVWGPGILHKYVGSSSILLYVCMWLFSTYGKNAHVYQKQPYFDFKKLVLTFAFAYVCAWYIEYALSYPAVRKVFSFSPGNSVL